MLIVTYMQLQLKSRRPTEGCVGEPTSLVGASRSAMVRSLVSSAFITAASCTMFNASIGVFGGIAFRSVIIHVTGRKCQTRSGAVNSGAGIGL